MTDRIPLDHLTSDALDALYEQLEAAEQTESERQLATAREALASATTRAAHVEATIARVQALADRWDNALGIDKTYARALHAALAEPGPAATQTTEPAWTPPPPGDRREQLPDHLLDLIRGSIPDYTSTACVTAYTLAVAVHWSHPQRAELGQWAERMHQRCRINQKFTGQICQCFCHEAADGHASGGPDA